MQANSNIPAALKPAALKSAALTPAMRSVIDRMARAGHPPLYTLPPSEARAAYAKGCDVLEVPKAPLPRVQDLAVPTRDGAQLLARLYAPSFEVLPVLMYIHGGGFTIGSVQTHDIFCRELARLAHIAVVSIDYRLAPEHPFPVAVDDCWDALVWLKGQGAALGLDASRLAVGGDSAGGTLAAVCALSARDAGLPLALQMLIYPGTIAQADTPSHSTYAQGYVLGSASIDYFFGHYIPDRAQREDWRFAPINAEDHSSLAPAWIGLAECDPLVDEGIAYGDVLRAAGVKVDLEIYRGVTHEFIKMGRAIPEAKLAHQQASAALRYALHSSN
jgi:acetyl esterase